MCTSALDVPNPCSLQPLLQVACSHLRVPWFQDEDREEWKQVHDLCITSKLQQD